MKAATLKSSINESVRNNGDVLLSISKLTDKSIGTVRNWFYQDSILLTTYSVLKVISSTTGTKVEDLVDEN